jgi:N-acetylneuraminic acid mutarotase
LSAQAQSSTSVKVTWTDNSADETGFVVERAGSDGVFAPVATLPAGTVQHSDTTVAAGTTYQYRVRATGNGDPSAYSNTASVSTPAATAKWRTAASLPIAMGEVGAGIIGNKMYVIGDGTNQTLAYNIDTNAWTSGLAQRPFLGNHHGVEVVSGKLYVIGGIGASSGKLQVYDPATNSWSVKASMPFSAGSCATAQIDGKIYVAGGVVGSSAMNNAGTGTTGEAAVYDIATDKWSSIPSMPHALNHAASNTDGKLFYIFGGRGGNNNTSNGFNTVQIYDPATNTWRSSETPGSGIAPLPQARGGTGKAVYANGEFYVMGGETQNGAGANSFHTYSRVDIYNPVTNTWRRGPDMITGRHGIFPVYSAGHIYVAGGGPRSMQIGFNASNILEIMDI